MWMNGYFEKELNIQVYHHPEIFERSGRKFFIGHGDGLGPGDQGYKFIKKIFRNPLCKWLFAQLHPTLGIRLANYFSRKSREKTGSADEHFLGEDNEWLIVYCKEIIKTTHYDFFIFGHRHYPIDFALSTQSRYINLGDWIRNFSYARFNGKDMILEYWQRD